jgi:hypothetical protein
MEPPKPPERNNDASDCPAGTAKVLWSRRSRARYPARSQIRGRQCGPNGDNPVIDVHHSNFTILIREAGPVRPSHPIKEWVRRWPQLGRVDLGGSSGVRSDSSAWVEVSPKTSVSISLEFNGPRRVPCFPLEADQFNGARHVRNSTQLLTDKVG